MKVPLIALLTDFGTRDVYAGVMKAVIARIAPGVEVVDLTHNIAPADVRGAAFALWQAAPYLPEGSVIVAVVDPGVGGPRRAVAVRFPRLTLVCPDNGLITLLTAREGGYHAVELTATAFRLPPIGSTFHGRDIFAPAAAHLASGVPFSRLGPEVHDLILLPYPRLVIAERSRGTGEEHAAADREAAGHESAAALSAGAGREATEGGAAEAQEAARAPSSPALNALVSGEVLKADRFGNLVTSIGFLRAEERALFLVPWVPCTSTASCTSEVPRAPEVPFTTGGGRALEFPLRLAGRGFFAVLSNGRSVPLVRAFSDVPEGSPLSYIGSDDLLEIAVNGGSASELFGCGIGDEVFLSLRR